MFCVNEAPPLALLEQDIYIFVFLFINLSNNINLSFCRLYVMISIKNVVLFSRDSIIRNVVTSDAFNLLMIVVERN